MTSNRIKESALNHFAKNGYEGTSLAQIAEDVGIKKQSIYTHFKGKDELFLHICNEVFQKELHFVNEFIEAHQNKSLHDFLFGFLQQYKERYEHDDYTKFWLRISFFPPAHLYDQVMKLVYEYLDRSEELILPFLDHAVKEGVISSSIDVQKAVTAYFGVLDAIFVELIYGGLERTQKRLDASWYLYWRGLSTGE
nr:TetR/AcrR family transcriptional regulator [Neobacillus sp. Marseille-Q6967]